MAADPKPKNSEQIRNQSLIQQCLQWGNHFPWENDKWSGFQRKCVSHWVVLNEIWYNEQSE